MFSARIALATTAILAATSCWSNKALADVDPAIVIRSALEHWRDDFNARRADHICDLFAPTLRYDFQGLPEQNYTLICKRLHHALADRAQSYQYGLHIKEVIVSGSLAVVRLTWTSTFTSKDGKQESEDEPGLDVFERQPDSKWRIIRYMAYPEILHPEPPGTAPGLPKVN